MLKQEKQVAKPKRRSLFVAINVLGVLAIAVLIIWKTGFDLHLWQRTTALSAVPVSKALALAAAPVPPKSNDFSIPREGRKLILVRVHPGRNASEGSAELGVARESPQTYQAGALLENGARLAEIYSDYVVLNKNERFTRLYLDTATMWFKGGNDGILMVGGAVESPPPAKITNREVLTDYVRPSPVYDGDNLVGFQVYPGSKSAPFYQMGLQSGDVIVQVNDFPLTNPTTSWDLLRGLADGVVLSVVIKSGTGVQQLTLNGALLVSAEASKRQGSAQAMLAPPIE